MLVFGFDLPLWVCLIVLVTTLLYIWGTKGHDFFSKQGIPYVKPWPIIGSQPEVIKGVGFRMDKENHKKYGPTFGTFHGRTPHLYTIDQDLIRRIMLKDFDHFTNRRAFEGPDTVFMQTLDQLTDEKWKKMRSGMSPIFTSGKLKGMMKSISSCADSLVERIKQNIEKEGNELDLTQ